MFWSVPDGNGHYVPAATMAGEFIVKGVKALYTKLWSFVLIHKLNHECRKVSHV